MIFDVDFSALVPRLLPVRMRLYKHIQWLRALLLPAIWLKSVFDANRGGNLYFSGHGCQVYSLEAVLNDALDPMARGIYIVDGAYVDPDYIFLVDESRPVWLGLVSEEGTTTYADPLPLYTGTEVYSTGYQFVVMVPTAVSMSLGYSTARVKGLVDKYRLPSKWNYGIVLY